jgi:sugar/nucleoside kinase (ribokinase family)
VRSEDPPTAGPSDPRANGLLEARDEGAGSRPRCLGVMGTLVWDRIFHRDGRREPVEEWGGISYAIEALSVVLPKGWEMKPILKIGDDLAERALDYLGSIPRVKMGPAVHVVPFPSYQVELRYQDETRRLERLSGGIPPWTWEEMGPLLDGVDALYFNFITGLETGLETVQHLREETRVPLYADLHSLFQGISSHGQRFPRELPAWGSWFRSFDAVQMNETEFELMGRSWGDPWELAAGTVGPELKLISVTMGADGAAYVAAPEFSSDPESWPALRDALSAGGASRSGRAPLTEDPLSGDPTGCGDVWGATFFARLLGGDSLEGAMADANRLAAKNVKHRGARGLRHHLMGVLSS